MFYIFMMLYLSLISFGMHSCNEKLKNESNGIRNICREKCLPHPYRIEDDKCVCNAAEIYK